MLIGVMMRPLTFGLVLPAGSPTRAGRTTFVADLNGALRLVTGHFDSAWMIDHLQDGTDDMLESFTTISYLAALYPHVRFGHTVICQSFRNPALLAKMVATLQFLSGGRFMLGIGAGWNEEEYRAYGYAFPAAAVRVEQLEETLQIIKAMWTQERGTFQGRHYQVLDATCEPKPDPIPPLIIGAFKPRMLRLTATYADGWDVSSTGIVPYRRLTEVFAQACTEVGRDPTTVRRSWSGGCVCAPTQAAAEAIGGDRYSAQNQDDFSFVGTPQQIVAQMEPFIALGVDAFLLDCGGFPNLTTLELLVHEVLPVVTKATA
jgi:alkanesulfonate monooxygenase SsuD/methylene tetrahydromethanopterin reductase-like flavin-dependent oxidoreductase (luciferase family)